MKKLNLLIVIMLLFFIQILPQNWPTAPEVWSEPVLLDSVFNVPYKWHEAPALTPNLDTIYFAKGSIWCSVKSNGRWETPEQLNLNINPNGVYTRNCSISKDGKRLYFSGWGGYGGWDLWYSDWDTLTNDWGPRYNMGPAINSASVDLYLYEVNKDTIYTTSDVGFPNYFIYDNKKEQWVKVDSFWNHQLGGAEMMGLSLTKNKKKMYFGKFRNEKEWSLDLCVCYWDTVINYWGDVKYLNINTKCIIVGNLKRRGAECYPWISKNGKILIFSSNRDVSLEPDSSNTTSLYISYLLIDENGDTVTTVSKNETPNIKSFTLEQNYPNPFNPSTIINYSVFENGNIRLVVYDALGKKITELVNEYKLKGNYTLHFNARKYNLASGSYYYQLIQDGKYEVKKMILTK